MVYAWHWDMNIGSHETRRSTDGSKEVDTDMCLYEW